MTRLQYSYTGRNAGEKEGSERTSASSWKRIASVVCKLKREIAVFLAIVGSCCVRSARHFSPQIGERDRHDLAEMQLAYLLDFFSPEMLMSLEAQIVNRKCMDQAKSAYVHDGSSRITEFGILSTAFNVQPNLRNTMTELLCLSSAATIV